MTELKFNKFKKKLLEHLGSIYSPTGEISEINKKLYDPALKNLYDNIELKLNGVHKYNVDNFESFSEEKLRLMKIRRDSHANRPAFHAYLSKQYKKIPEAWRRPKGPQNKLRRGLKDKGTLVRVGYGAPASLRHFDVKGYNLLRVENQTELNHVLSMNPKTNIIVLSRKLGLKKKILFENQLYHSGFHIKNPSNILKI